MAGIANFTHVQVTPYEDPVQFNRYGKPLWRLCAWCRSVATWHLSRVSKLSGNTYSDIVCDGHIQEWMEVAEPVQLGMEI